MCMYSALISHFCSDQLFIKVLRLFLLPNLLPIAMFICINVYLCNVIKFRLTLTEYIHK